MFNHEEIRARVRRAPFTPFQIVTSAGDAHSVLHPELIMIGVRDVAVGLPSPDHPTAYDRMTRIAIIHITELRDLPVPAGAPNNGST